MASLSVIIATHNEEQHIGACIDSVRTIADEILVADGASTDQTAQIARAHGAVVMHLSNKRMFHENKEEARKVATGDWILFLDADERVPEALGQEISSVLAGTHTSKRLPKQFAKHMHQLELRDGVTFQREAPYVAFFIARKNYFLGSFLMHSGVYPDGVIRLVRAGKGFWPCKDVHETMRVDGGVSWLFEPMIHMADPTFARYLHRANRYTDLTAHAYEQKKITKDVLHLFLYLVIKPVQTFVVLYVRHKGFLDGMAGFFWALLSALHHPVAYLKYLSILKKN